MGSEGWVTMPFTEAVLMNPSVELTKGTACPFVEMAAVDPSARSVRESEIREFKGGGARFIPGDTLMARITPCLENGKIARFQPTDGTSAGFGSTEFIVIRGRSGVTDNDFAYYLTKWPEFRQFAISQMTGSSGRQRVPALSLAHFEVPIPPLSEQRTIAHILGSLDDKIELNRKMNETLEAIARTLFESWFVRFDPVRRNMARKKCGQPSPPSSLPEVEGHYRGGYDFSGLLETARELRKKQTSAETLFWEVVRDRRFMGLKFRRQHQIGDYIADFYCHEKRLVIELDGGVHSQRQKKDHKRDAWMKAQGFKVLRLPNEQVLEDPQSVLEQIAAHCSAGKGSFPLPVGEGQGEGSVEELDRLFPDSFEDSEIGPIPKGWCVKYLPEVIEVNPSRSLPRGTVAPHVPMKEMPTTLSRPTGWWRRKFNPGSKFQNGDVPLAPITPCLENGKTAFVDFLDGNEIGWGATEYIVLRSKPPLPPEFTYCLARSEKLREHAIANMTGTSGRQRTPPSCFDVFL